MAKQIALIIVPIALIALVFIILFVSKPDSIPHIDDGLADDLIPDILKQIEEQVIIDERLLAELNSDQYSFEDPLVIIDPYGLSPLTAIALFTSEEPIQISLHIAGKTKFADVDFTFYGFNTSHLIPIYGLYPGEVNEVELKATLHNGESKNKNIEIITDSLPPELSRYIIQTDLVKPANYQPGFNFTYSYKSAFDVNGEYRWFYNDFLLLQSTVNDYQGNIIVSKGAYHEGDVLLYEINKLGKILRVYYSPYGVHHDIIAIENGNFLATGNFGDTVEDFIYEIDTQSGEIVNTLDLKTILQRTRTSGSPIYTTQDWFHHNAIDYDDGSIIISGRRQSAVVKLTWPAGKVEWILSDHIGWNPMFQKYLLNPIGTDFEWFYGQHTPNILPDLDNDPDTIDIIMFDNGIGRFDNDMELQRAIANHEIVAPELYSRMVQYRINEKDKTIEQIWQYGKELGEVYYSFWRGDAKQLDNGNRLGTFDRNLSEKYGDFNTNFIEVDYSGNIVWEVYATSTEDIGAFASYRLARLPLYTLSDNDLQIGIPAQNYIPPEKLNW